MTGPRGPIDWANQQQAEREQQPARKLLDQLTDAELGELYEEREQLLAELDGRSEEARERWIQKQLDETGLKSMDFRNGMTMDIEPARDMVAQWVGAARAMLGDAPNYTETPIEMVVKVAEAPERFAFTLQRVGKLTPHQARQAAEQRAEKAEAANARVRSLADDLCFEEHPGHDHLCPDDVRDIIRAALDEPKEPRT